MSMLDMSLREFNSELSSRSAVPGGGGASALCAALAASLGGMVCALTSGKAKFAGVQPRLDELAVRAEKLRDELLSLVDGDAEAFEPLSRAYSRPKDAPGRDELMEECLLRAAEAPMAILEKSCEVIALHEELSGCCSRLAVSDAGTGAVLARGAMYGAAMNVLVNTRLMKDRERAQEMNSRVNELMGEYRKRADAAYESIFKELSRSDSA